MSRTSTACPASRAVPFAASSSIAKLHRRRVDNVPVPAAGGGDQTVARRRESAARCIGRRRRRCTPMTRPPAAVPLVLRCHLAGPSGLSTGSRAPRPRGARPGCSPARQGRLIAADLPFGFGADVPDLPGRSAVLHHRHNPIGGLGDPPWHPPTRAVSASGANAVAIIAVMAPAAAEDCRRLGQPDAALFGFGAGFVFGVTGFQRGLLGQVGVLRLGWVAGHGRFETGRPVRRAGC